MARQNKKEEYKDKLNTLATEVTRKISQNDKVTIQFCGPISTGGFGNVEENMAMLSSVIQYAQEKSIPVFDQTAYERTLDKILGLQVGYDYELLEYFYKPILSSGKIGALIFLPMWQTSTGSRWEYEFGKSLNIPIFYLENNLSKEIDMIYANVNGKRNDV